MVQVGGMIQMRDASAGQGTGSGIRCSGGANQV